jgi:hypothetical protein
MSSRCNPLASTRRTIASAVAAGAVVALAGGLLTASSQAAALPTVTATVSPTSVTISGALQAGAVNVLATATSGKEPAILLFQVKPGVTINEVYAYLESNKLANDPNAASKFGTITLDAEAAKGKPTETQTTLAPGQYIAMNPEGEKPSKWPRTSFAVAATPSPLALPTPEATERTIDFGFKGPAVLHDGELVRWENEGYLVHMDFGFPVKSRKAAQKVVVALLTGHEKGLEKLAAGPPAGFAGPLSPGAFQQSVVTARPGWYVQVCFMETQDGRPHTRLGMERIIKISK